MRNKNLFIIGILIMCIGTQTANYGGAVVLTGAIAKMGAAQYYVFISALGTLGMMLILPLLGKLIGIFGLRTIISIGILIQTAARFGMMFSNGWVLFAVFTLFQAIGSGCYLSAAYLNISDKVESYERAKYFGFIATANAVGAISGSLLVSELYQMGGIFEKLSFIAFLPIVITGYIIIYKNCSNIRNPELAKGYDYIGLIMLVFSVSGLVMWLCLVEKAFPVLSVGSLLIAVATIVSTILMLVRELRIKNPAVPFGMLRNRRIKYAFIGGIVNAAYCTCTGAYVLIWITLNYSQSNMYTVFRGTGVIAQQLVVFLLGIIIGGFITKKFELRFRRLAVFAMVTAALSCAILFCLRYTGTAEAGNVIWLIKGFPLGMLLIYTSTALGGVLVYTAQSSFSAFWQATTPKEQISAGQTMCDFAATGGACVFSSVCGLLLGSGTDYSITFAAGFAVCIVGIICAVKGFVVSAND